MSGSKHARLAGGLAFAGLLGATAAAAAPSEPPPRLIQVEKVGTGRSYRFARSPEDPLLNAQVDLGTLRAVGDELEVELRWPVTPGYLNDLRIQQPELVVPPGASLVDRERVVCKPDGVHNFAVSSDLVAPDGKVLRHRRFDPAQERKKDEARGWSGSYGPDPRSLVCWAVARKCGRQPAPWPPPPNLTPLEHSERARQMRQAYNRQFVPTCVLKSTSGPDPAPPDAAGSATPAARPAAPFSVRLRMDVVGSGAARQILAHLTFTNTSDKPARLVKFITGAEGLRGQGIQPSNDFFEVQQVGGGVLEYRGPLARRAPPGKDGFHRLSPGATVTGAFRLDSSYAFAPSGARYRIRFRTTNMFAGGQPVSSNEAQLTL